MNNWIAIVYSTINYRIKIYEKNHNKKYRIVIINYCLDDCLDDASHKVNNMFYDRATCMTCDKELITEIKSGGKTIDQNMRATF